jgi:hypothetical protein
MNLASINNCRKCKSGYFVSGAPYGEYCCRDCQESDSYNVDFEERISELEDKLVLSEKRVTLLEKKLQLCLDKLEIDDISELHTDTQNSY